MNYNTIRKTILMSTAIVASVFAFAQEAENMVPNGSFEGVEKAPKKLGQIESATGWYSPTGVRADLFVDSKKYPDINVPLNAKGKEEAKDGENYAGIVTFSHGDKVPRSYIMTKLSVPMKKGMKYCVQYYVSMAECSKYGSNQIGVNFSKRPFATDTKASIIDKNHVVHERNKIINAAYGWEKVCGVYVAEGGEKFITLGNFVSNEDTKSERNKPQRDVKVDGVIAAYYFIDNISVHLIDENYPCDCAPDDDSDMYSKLIYQRAYSATEDMTDKQIIEANSVYFAFGKDQLTVDGQTILDEIAKKMLANPEMKLQVKGHADAMEAEVGMQKPQYNNMDSKRVNAVMLYLMEKGIAENRLISSPQGSETPSSEISDADDDQEVVQAKNRRVEFVLR